MADSNVGPGQTSSPSSTSSTSSPPSGGSNTFEIIIIAILIIVLVILITLAFYYARQRGFCFTYPSPYCYSDWECPNESDPNKRFPWQGLMSMGLVASDPTEGACYAGASDGINPNQKNCPNAWENFLNGPPKRPPGDPPPSSI